MKLRTPFLCVLLPLLLTACGLSLVAPCGTIESLDRFPMESIVIDDHDRSYPITVWIADTPPRRSQGLMQVSGLDANCGMLLLFDHPTRPAIWMKNMAISLDLLFIAADGKVLTLERNVTPDSLRSVRPDDLVTGVMELPGGTAARLQLETGVRIRHAHFVREPREAILSPTNEPSYLVAKN